MLNLHFDSAEWSMVLGDGKRGSTRRQEEGRMVQVIHAALLPAPAPGLDVKDPFSGDRPILGILCVSYLYSTLSGTKTLSRMQTDYIEDEECDSSFVLYSLRNHQLVKRLALSGSTSTFIANDHFIIVVSHPSLFVFYLYRN